MNGQDATCHMSSDDWSEDTVFDTEGSSSWRNRVEDTLKRKEMSKVQLATELGLHPSQISRLLRTNKPAHLVEQVNQLLGITIAAEELDREARWRRVYDRLLAHSLDRFDTILTGLEEYLDGTEMAQAGMSKLRKIASEGILASTLSGKQPK